MKISGLQKLTLLDFPGHTACTVFTGGCDFRCPFCHNSALVKPEGGFPEMDIEEFFTFLKKRSGVLDGVAITGGEPTLQKGILDFMARIKDMGLAVKLDTNGGHPNILCSAVEKKLCDYIAMDIKAAPSKYAQTIGIPNYDIAPVKESVSLLMTGKTPFEFRTTAVKELHKPEDFEEIGRWIAGEEPYFIQKFKDSGDILCTGMSECDNETMEKMLNTVQKFVPNAALRGV